MDIGTVAKELPELEPVISDMEVSLVEGRLRERFMGAVPDNTRFVTFIQEPKEYTQNGRTVMLGRMAVFACISNHPTTPWAPDIMTYGACLLSDFEDAREEQKHYVKGNRIAPAIVIFAQVLQNHMTTLNNLREIVH